MKASVSQRAAEYAKRDLFVGKYYSFGGFMKFNKPHKEWQYEIQWWAENTKNKSNPYADDPTRLREENKPKFIRKDREEGMLH